MPAFIKTILIAALATTPVLGASLPTRDTASTANKNGCVSGAHIIVARASTEAPGPGIIGAVALNVSAQVPNSDIVAVDYPATLTNYPSSEGAGTLAMRALLADYQKNCPGHRIVLMGYSQGAQVTADTICGTSEVGFNTTKGASGGGVAAVVLMGDPSHVPNLSFDRGNSTHNGLFPRQDTSCCHPLFPRIRSYCDAGDAFCDSGTGANNITIHLGYVPEYGPQAVKFIVNELKLYPF